jgi:hypothetical protein
LACKKNVNVKWVTAAFVFVRNVRKKYHIPGANPVWRKDARNAVQKWLERIHIIISKLKKEKKIDDMLAYNGKA